MARDYREHARTLVILRHAKSDWDTDEDDVERPLAARGRRQAPEAGRWLATHLELELALVSPATRAQQTWQLASAEFTDGVPTRTDDRLYTFSARDVLRVVHALPDTVHRVAVVGHNPALEGLVAHLTGDHVPMPTSAIAVVGLDTPWGVAGHEGVLLAHGRPPA